MTGELWKHNSNVKTWRNKIIEFVIITASISKILAGIRKTNTD